MKELMICLLFFNLIISCYLIIPVWNFNKSTINLLTSNNSFTYSNKIYDKEFKGKKFKIQKIIKKEEENIIETNTLYINEENIYNTIWEDIESAYIFDNIIYLSKRKKLYA